MAATKKTLPIPDPRHRKLKAQTAFKGESLPGHSGHKSQRAGKRLSLKKVLARVANLSPVNPRVPPAQIIREERDRQC